MTDQELQGARKVITHDDGIGRRALDCVFELFSEIERLKQDIAKVPPINLAVPGGEKILAHYFSDTSEMNAKKVTGGDILSAIKPKLPKEHAGPVTLNIKLLNAIAEWVNTRHADLEKEVKQLRGDRDEVVKLRAEVKEEIMRWCGEAYEHGRKLGEAHKEIEALKRDILILRALIPKDKILIRNTD